MSKVEVKYVDAEKLKPNPNNSRQHTEEQINKIAKCIKQYGFLVPAIIAQDNTIIAGHARVLAAQKTGMAQVPTICADHLSKDQQRAFMLADNKLAQLAEWNTDALAIELKHLASIDFDLDAIGFETPEIDILIHGDQTEDPAEECHVADGPAITKAGDLWLLGKHKLYCGDALMKDSYDILMGTELAQMTFTDPPYNVAIAGNVSGKGKIKHREFAMASGEMTPDAFTVFLTNAHKHIAAYSKDGAIIFSCMDWRHLREVLQAAVVAGLDLKNLCVWVKDNGGMGSLYRSRHELVLVLKNGTAKHVNNIELGKHGRNRTNVWEYPGVNTFVGGRMKEQAMHPTVKPSAMVADAIMDCSEIGAIVLDPFGGSGTTLIAAEQTGRQGRLIELDPIYCDTTIRRWQEVSGKQAIHTESGRLFNEIAQEAGHE